MRAPPFVLAALAVALIHAPALAQLSVSHSRADWRSALGGTGNLSDDFSGRGSAITSILGTPLPIAGSMTIRRVWTPGPTPSGIAQIINFGPVSQFGGNYLNVALIAPSVTTEHMHLDLAFASPLRSFGFDAAYNRDPIRSLVEWRFFDSTSQIGAFQLRSANEFSGVILSRPATRAEVWAVRPSDFDSTSAPFTMGFLEAHTVPAPAALTPLLSLLALRRRR